MAVSFSEDIFDQICDRLSGGESLASICRASDMPSQPSVYEWIRKDKYLARKYGLARDAQADFYADEIIEIADNCEDPQKARVRIDARKWKAARMAPKKYGDKVSLDHHGTVDTVTKIELVAPVEKLRQHLEKLNGDTQTDQGIA